MYIKMAVILNVRFLCELTQYGCFVLVLILLFADCGFLFRGPTEWCSWLTSGSVFREHFLWFSRDYIPNWLVTYKVSALTTKTKRSELVCLLFVIVFMYVYIMMFMS